MLENLDIDVKDIVERVEEETQIIENTKLIEKDLQIDTPKCTFWNRTKAMIHRTFHWNHHGQRHSIGNYSYVTELLICYALFDTSSGLIEDVESLLNPLDIDFRDF